MESDWHIGILTMDFWFSLRIMMKKVQTGKEKVSSKQEITRRVKDERVRSENSRTARVAGFYTLCPLALRGFTQS